MTALTDLYSRLTAEPVPSRGRQAASPEFIVALIAKKLRAKQCHLVCIDEAQEISVENIKLLRQIPDAAKAIGHPMGILYIGLEELRDHLVSAGQLGQRVGTEIHFPLVDRATLAPHFHGFHPAWPPCATPCRRRTGRSSRRPFSTRPGGSSVACTP